MSKSTNKQQLQQLITLMEANPEIGQGFFKGGKEELQRFWRVAEDKLNSLGPPHKSIPEWKKVWADQKKYVRQKATQNLQYQKGTGGGPNKEYKFSTSEQAIYNLTNVKSSVEGVDVIVFGLGTVGKTVSEATHDPVYTDGIVLDDLQEPECAPSNCEATPNARKCEKQQQKAAIKSSSDALEAEIAIQREMLNTMKLAVVDIKENHQSTKKIYRSIDKLIDIQKKHFEEMEKLKKDQLKEMRRHNAFMEEMRKREVEYKLEKNRLQIENLNDSL